MHQAEAVEKTLPAGSFGEKWKMAKKQNKYLNAVRAHEPFMEGEEYVGSFMARSRVTGWFLLIGPLAALTMKTYQVIVTNKRIWFGKFSMIGKLTGVDKFAFDEIKSATFKRGMLTYTIKFEFKNGRSLAMDANHKAYVSMEGFLVEPAVVDYLTAAI